MKKLILIAFSLSMVACGKSGAGSDKASFAPTSYVGVWDGSFPAGSFCREVDGSMSCDLVSPPHECTGATIIGMIPGSPGDAFEIESPTRGGWYRDMETISIVGDQIKFQTTGLQIQMDYFNGDLNKAYVTFASGCTKMYRRI